MSEELQQKLRDQLWEVANKLRGNMSASDFMYFTLGFIFYKYLSEKIEKHGPMMHWWMMRSRSKNYGQWKKIPISKSYKRA